MEGLSPREQQVYSLLGLGRTRAQIVQEIGFSKKTYEVYLSNIKIKKGCETAMELRRMAALESEQGA